MHSATSSVKTVYMESTAPNVTKDRFFLMGIDLNVMIRIAYHD